eukprot:1191825-Prorocentrum_minimum.AAC.4
MGAAGIASGAAMAFTVRARRATARTLRTGRASTPRTAGVEVIAVLDMQALMVAVEAAILVTIYFLTTEVYS